MPKKPDDIVGQSQGPIVGGGIGTVEATEAETPPENLKRISNPSLPLGTAAAQDAVARATSTAGQDDRG